MCLSEIESCLKRFYKEFCTSIWCFFEKSSLITSDSELILENSEQNVRLMQYEKIQHEAKELFRKKNADYGDSFSTFGSIGVIVRMGDKISRLNTIDKNKIINVDNETLRDTLIDLHNYSAMAIMLMDE